MSGPFNLRYLHLFVRERSAGAFILSRNGRSADFVGASTTDVANALRQYGSQSGYRYFWFAYSNSPEEAVQLELTWYHRYHPADNAVPPARNHGADWHCTAEGCAACALIQSRR
ncbi:MAG: hypothetical protein AB1411_08720 [Nitrospirota bacterium]